MFGTEGLSVLCIVLKVFSLGKIDNRFLLPAFYIEGYSEWIYNEQV